MLTYEQLIQFGEIDRKGMDDEELRERVNIAVRRICLKLWRDARDCPVEPVLPGQSYPYRTRE